WHDGNRVAAVGIAPAGLVRSQEGGMVGQAADLPHAILFHVFVLVDAPGPVGTFAIPAHHRYLVPAAAYGASIRIEGDHRAHDQMRVQVALAEPRASGPSQCLRLQPGGDGGRRSEEHTSELQSRENLVCRLLLEKKKEP